MLIRCSAQIPHPPRFGARPGAVAALSLLWLLATGCGGDGQSSRTSWNVGASDSAPGSVEASEADWPPAGLAPGGPFRRAGDRPGRTLGSRAAHDTDPWLRGTILALTALGVLFALLGVFRFQSKYSELLVDPRREGSDGSVRGWVDPLARSNRYRPWRWFRRHGLHSMATLFESSPESVLRPPLGRRASYTTRELISNLVISLRR